MFIFVSLLLEKLKNKLFSALVNATKNNVLSSSKLFSFFSIFASSASCNHSQTIHLGSFNFSITLLLFQFQS
jgi:hypothetical protein